MSLVPVTRDVTRAFVERHHSHHHKPNTYIAAVGVESDGVVVCVAILELPKSRMLCNGHTTEVSRVASDGTTDNSGSMAIGAITRTALSLGYKRLVSYTILGEAGSIYRAANWWPTAISAGGSWNRPSRPCGQRESTQRGEKVRWEYGPNAEPKNETIDVRVRESVGRVEIFRRNDTLPLFATRGEGET